MDNQSREKLDSHASLETSKAAERTEKPAASKEVKSKASELLKTESAEGKEGQEGTELSEGRVGEVSGEDKAYAPAGQGKTNMSTDEIEAIRAKLLAALPPQEIMIKQIKKKLYNNEKVLTKQMNKLSKNAHRNAFQLNIVVGQLRKVREFFSMLAHATYEMIKHLWLKIVHGV